MDFRKRFQWKGLNKSFSSRFELSKMGYPLWQLQTELFLMELEHLTVLLSFILFPCIIFGLGLVLLFLRRWITNTVMHVISSMYCRASFVNQTFKTKHHKWSPFILKSFIFELSLSLRPDSQDKEALDEEEETLGATYILLLTILTLLFVFLIINVIVLLLM